MAESRVVPALDRLIIEGAGPFGEPGGTVVYGRGAEATKNAAVAIGSYAKSEGVGSVAIGAGTHAREGEVVIGGSFATSFRVGDWFHVSKADDAVLVPCQWITAIDDRLAFLDGLVNCMSIDIRHLRERLNNT